MGARVWASLRPPGSTARAPVANPKGASRYARDNERASSISRFSAAS